MDVGNGHSITQQNRDSVLDKFPGTDGLKTGHTDAAGYGITVSAVRNGQRLILVLNGLRYPQLDKMTPAAQDWHGVQLRGDEAARLMGIAFREFRQYRCSSPAMPSGRRRSGRARSDSVPLDRDSKPLDVTMQVDSAPGMKVTLVYDGPVQAPIAKGQQIGMLNVTAPDYPGAADAGLCRQTDVPRAGIFARMYPRPAHADFRPARR